jgi:hypothetical protein
METVPVLGCTSSEAAQAQASPVLEEAVALTAPGTTATDAGPINTAACCPNGVTRSEVSSSKDDGLLEQRGISTAAPTRLSSEQVLRPSTYDLETTKIRFLTVTGKAFTVSFPVYATIGQMKEALLSLRPVELDEQQQALQRPPLSDASELRILYLGGVLDDSDTLLECGFQVGVCQTVHVIIRPTSDMSTITGGNTAAQKSPSMNFVSYLWSSPSPSRNRGRGTLTRRSESRGRHEGASNQGLALGTQTFSNRLGTRNRSQRGGAPSTEATRGSVENERARCTPCSIM